MTNHPIIIFPSATEKSIKLMEAENKLVFIVNNKAKKPEIKEEIEKQFNVKVLNVKTAINRKGQKKAYVKFSPETPAIDIATRLGLM